MTFVNGDLQQIAEVTAQSLLLWIDWQVCGALPRTKELEDTGSIVYQVASSGYRVCRARAKAGGEVSEINGSAIILPVSYATQHNPLTLVS